MFQNNKNYRISDINESINKAGVADVNYSYSTYMDRVLYRCKVNLLGDIAVGKTSILSRFVDDKYISEYWCIKRVEFKVKSLYFGADFQIWDTCDEEIQDNYKTILQRLNEVILIFEITNRNSFEN